MKNHLLVLWNYAKDKGLPEPQFETSQALNNGFVSYINLNGKIYGSWGVYTMIIFTMYGPFINYDGSQQIYTFSSIPQGSKQIQLFFPFLYNFNSGLQ